MWTAFFLVLFAMLLALIGGLNLTVATAGAGTICGACFVAILARMAQAEYLHKQILKQLAQRSII